MDSAAPAAPCPEAGDGDVVVPGDFICPASRYRPGRGVAQRQHNLFATLVGRVRVGECAPGETRKAVRVEGRKGPMNVPQVGSVVLCKVESISERQAKLTILSVDGGLLREPLSGVLRREDLRATEKDSVMMAESLRPADVVRCRVVSLGEGQPYVVSTAEDELGVVVAVGEGGEVMEPVSWCEVQGVRTGAKARRKSAKVTGAVPE